MANELQKFLDSGGVSHLYILIKGKLTEFFKSIFVEKESGKGLSTNDFTNDLKNKLESLSSNTSPSEPIVSEENVLIVDLTVTGTEEEPIVEISDSELQKLKYYDGLKKLYIHFIDSFVYMDYLPLHSSEDNMVFYIIGEENTLICVNINLDSGICEFFEQHVIDIIQDFDSDDISDASVPSVGAIIDYISSNIGVSNGVASLDENGKVPMNQLPSYVDDVVEGYYNESDSKFYTSYNEEGNIYSDKINGESSKIYIDLHSSMTYRFGGTVYVPIESFINISPLSNLEIDAIIDAAEAASK